MNKEEKLENLREKIIDKHLKNNWDEVWFFKENREFGVKGYLGTQDIFFVGLNPSYGNFPSKPDIFFYEILRKYKFEQAHLTDLIKLRLANKEVNERLKDKSLLEEQIDYLKEEIAAEGIVFREASRASGWYRGCQSGGGWTAT